jgi:hypothetical protein
LSNLAKRNLADSVDLRTLDIAPKIAFLMTIGLQTMSSTWLK